MISPVNRMVSPFVKTGAIINKAEIYWELTLPGRLIVSFLNSRPVMRNGGKPSLATYSISAPNSRKALTSTCIVLDREGWADIDKLILCAQKAGKRLTRALLDTVVATSDKKRFSYSSDGRCIRAVQGHSTSQVAISFAEKTPPQFLYHGTASRFLDEIKKQGLIAGERHYVHLSADEATARKVGARHGSPVILTVKAQEMAKRGIPFWQAENGVWLTSTVAVEFLEW